MATTSPRKAIALNCRECIYDKADQGTWVQQVQACTITTCHLHQHRPLTGKTKHLQRETHLASLSAEQRALIELRNETSRQNMLNVRSGTAAAISSGVAVN
ncbi:hypothetical protein ABXJ76_06785 [Methylobacter sp. G7]|uniref:hypothetical protein n=1 Tax=Methylobacter sp. G7 TaxID=3230117 RepID=UPI003D80618E